ncbi:alternative oxidase-domain-containing protein [Aspergillus granulosus]|uniref:Alternative oxidase n=1 Tax=Aspergillus granulosus TaxID=176169 RepID=A0ABR4HEE3_9EURO
MISSLATQARVIGRAPKSYQLLYARKPPVLVIPQIPLRSAYRFNSSAPGDNTKDFFRPPSAPHIKEVETAWNHPYTNEQMRAIAIGHRAPKNWSYRGMDRVSGYRHPTLGQEHQARFRMTEKKWLTRFIFLESVAGVPGMVGGMLRHLRSLRGLKTMADDRIETLLEEAYNERMHLLTFLKLAKPSLFMRLLVLGAQGVFFNGFFLSYLISPRICSFTYTCAIKDLETGKLPEWEKLEAPEIAVQYWKMPEGNRTMKDLLLCVRADEAKHRRVNYTFGNLNQESDPNPYAAKYKDLTHAKTIGWERNVVI